MIKYIKTVDNIPYILIEKHLKRCNLNFVLIKKDPLLMWHI